MNPFRWSYRAVFFAGFLICVGLLSFALYGEHYMGMIPCPLCIFQRIAFMVMAVFFLLGALFAPRGGLRWVYTGGVVIGALAGIGTAARHLWLQTLPADQIPSCGPNLSYMMDAFPFAQTLKMVFTGSGECAKIEPILGLPMPAWTLLWYLVLTIWAVSVALRKRASR
ncbi:disulfide bond formation protein B [Dyella tabacisoli]|uniref:Disulfide bond formation protein B n=1 Tax=Dyella tabacisoli TaxID=2282381 RepID=A0A369ULI7_9GAMM|nr:disulfide bond formation protein B [Dyella tabacisoli]RDD81622.1 disulfide bond formation protein B [Dyella tabacisoli]